MLNKEKTMAKHNVFDKYDVQKQKELLVQILTNEPPYKL